MTSKFYHRLKDVKCISVIENWRIDEISKERDWVFGSWDGDWSVVLVEIDIGIV